MSDSTAFEQLQDRCRGLMVGLGVGNLLGIVQEFMSFAEIQERWPDGVREIEAATGYPDDDDLAQAIVLAEAAMAAGTGALDVDDLGRRFWFWAEENGLGMGGLTGSVLTLIGGAHPLQIGRNGTPKRRRHNDPTAAPRAPHGLPALEAARAVWEESDRQSAGNGAVMRCAPLAIRWVDDQRALAWNSALSAAVTHADPRCIWSTVAVNLAIQPLLRGGDVAAPAVVARLREAAAQLRDSLEALGVEAELPENVAWSCALEEPLAVADLKLVGWDEGYTLKAMQVGLWCATQASDFEEALVAVVSAGGDTDTNGAVAGAVLGARFGLSSIPPRWRERMAEIREGRAPLEALADRLMTV